MIKSTKALVSDFESFKTVVMLITRRLTILRSLFVLISLTLPTALFAECPESAYLPAGYKHGMKINFREIAAFLTRHGIEANELRYLEAPGVRASENWIAGLDYADIDSAIMLTRKRADDSIGLICFNSAATLTRFKKAALQEQANLAKRSGKKLDIDEKRGTVDLAEGNARLMFTGRAIVFGRKEAVAIFSKNLANKSKSDSANFGGDKAQIFLRVDSDTFGNKDTRDIPDFGGLRQIALEMRGVQMQFRLKGEPQLTLGLVMSSKSMAMKVAALLSVYKELALGFSGAIDDRQARKAVTSLLHRIKFTPRGKNAEMKLQFQKFETALLIAWLQSSISDGKKRHAEHKEAIVQEQICSNLIAGKSNAAEISKVSQVNLRTSSGNYLVHCAASGGNLALVSQLRKKGADVNLQNGKDETAYDAAFNARQFAVAESLLNAEHEKKLHRALLPLAKTDKTMRLSSQTDGQLLIKVKTLLDRQDNDEHHTASPPMMVLPDGGKSGFELKFEAENPLVHPARDGAVYETTFTVRMRPEKAEPMPALTNADGENEPTPEAQVVAEEISDSPIIQGILLSARDPQYKEPVIPTASEEKPEATQTEDAVEAPEPATEE